MYQCSYLIWSLLAKYDCSVDVPHLGGKLTIENVQLNSSVSWEHVHCSAKSYSCNKHSFQESSLDTICGGLLINI